MEIQISESQKIAVRKLSKHELTTVIEIPNKEQFMNETNISENFVVLIQILTSSSFPLDIILSVFMYICDEIFNFLKQEPLDPLKVSHLELAVNKLEALNNSYILIDFIKRYFNIISHSGFIHLKLATAYQMLKKYDEAVMHYHILIGMKNEYTHIALNNICHIFLSLENNNAVLKYATYGHQLYPNQSQFLSILGTVNVNLRKFDEAKEFFAKEVEILIQSGDKNAISNVYSNLSVCLDRDYDYEESNKYLNLSLEYNPSNFNAFQSKLMNDLFNKISYENRFYSLEQHKKCVAMIAKTKTYQFPAEFYNTDKINIGFVSGDFEINHPVYIFLKTFLQGHDRNIFNITCYSQGSGSIPGLNIKSIKSMNQEQASDFIYNDKNNILIDLSGFTCKTRLDVFRNKPSPIQMTYCGYPSTTGMEEIDYRISDQICEVDVNIAQQYHVEKLLVMDDCFLCYSMMSMPTIVENIPDDYLIIGCYNRVNKITEYTTNMLIYILEQIQNVKIAFNAAAHRKDRLRNKFIERFPENVRNRLMFINSCGKTSHQHLETYNQINIHIDTNPYSGTTTTCDALSMGVPTFTIYDTITCFHVTNVSTSILKNSNLDYYVCSNIEDMKDKILELAQKPKEFWSNFKQTVRTNFFQGNAMNTQKHITNFTKLLLEVSKRETPEDIYLKYLNKDWNVDWNLIGGDGKLACVIVEPRCHKNLANVIKNIAHFTKYYPIIWCNSEENKDFLNEEFSKVQRLKISEGNMTIQQYNDLLTSADFWENFKDYERVLIFQTDTCMMKEGIEEFLDYDLIGAPWIDGWSKRIYPVNLICGNGGFTIRNPKLMIKICKNPNPIYNKVPEDYFFSAHVYDLTKVIKNIKVPNSIEEASRFCSETIMNENSLAMHAAYKFHSLGSMKKLLKNC